jgi:hypothetical protein
MVLITKDKNLCWTGPRVLVGRGAQYLNSYNMVLIQQVTQFCRTGPACQLVEE